MTFGVGLTEFVSEVEKLKPGRELPVMRSNDSLAFGKYRPFFPPEAVKHPARMDIGLLEYLLKNYTKEGETVLDPMAGTGATGILASLFGRHAICVEYEAKFFEWMLAAKRRVERAQTFGSKGKIVMIHGDARELSRLLEGLSAVVGSIVTSPPYYDVFDYERDPSINEKVDRWKEGGAERGYRGGVGVILTSPPYADAQLGDNIRSGGRGYWKALSRRNTLFSPENISNLPLADVAITSPPYEATLESAGNRGGIVRREAEGDGDATTIMRGVPVQYSADKNNIGNLKREAYEEAMVKVYREMFAVLRPGGRAVIVVRPFIRKRRVVDLPYITWLLLEKAGFRLVEVLKFRLSFVSFWRVLYYKKFKDVPLIMHEYVLMVEKPAA